MDPVADGYDPPKALQVVGNVLDFLRQEYSRDYALFATSTKGSFENSSYRAGLVFVASLFGGLLFIWVFVLIWFKLNSKQVGCAAGRAFEQGHFPNKPSRSRSTGMHSSVSENEHDGTLGSRNDQGFQPSSEQSSSDMISNFDMEGLSISVDSRDLGTDYTKSKEETATCPPKNEPRSNEEEQEEIVEIYSDEDSSGRNTASVDLGLASRSSERSIVGAEEIDHKRSGGSFFRERSTQLCFLFFALLSLFCAPVILVFCVKPVAVAVHESETYLRDSERIIDSSVQAVESSAVASVSALSVLRGMPSSINFVCPNAEATRVALDVDIAALFRLVRNDYRDMTEAVRSKISEIELVAEYYSDGYSFMDEVFDAAKSYQWALPTLALSMAALTSVGVVGLHQASRRQASLRFQRFLSYGLLPILIALTTTCWVIAAMAAIATAVSHDGCLAGSESGSPENFIMRVLASDDISSSTVEKYTIGLTRECVPDSLSDLETLEGEIDQLTQRLFAFLFKIDDVGIEDLSSSCGRGNYLSIFLSGTRDIEEHVSTMRQDLASLSASLSCEKLHSIYTKSVEGALCTDIAGAAAWGSFLFFCMGVGGMVMISLRASWRHKIVEERIYEESEVAENMIVDEHEQYLRYISRYKHEWEEYQGIDDEEEGQAIQNGSTESLENSEASNGSSSGGHGKVAATNNTLCSPVSNEGESTNEKNTFDPYTTDTNSHVSSVDNISFLSLSEPSPESVNETPTEIKVVVPPSLLYPEDEIQNDEIEIELSSDLLAVAQRMSDNQRRRPLPALETDIGVNDEDLLVSSIGTPVSLLDPPKSFRSPLSSASTEQPQGGISPSKYVDSGEI